MVIRCAIDALPAPPTHARSSRFLNMVHYLTRSLRVRGGRYRDAPMIVTVGAETRDPDLARNHPWLADNGVEVRWVGETLFARESWYGTACERFRYEFTSDVVLALAAPAGAMRSLGRDVYPLMAVVD